MLNLFKSRILSYSQCEKKLWLEVRHKELATDSESSQKNFDVGNTARDISRETYGKESVGTLRLPFVCYILKSRSKDVEVRGPTLRIYSSYRQTTNLGVITSMVLRTYGFTEKYASCL